jgi:predicted nucleic acid-binding protein
MRVVLDTNVIVADFLMKSNAFKVLRSSPRNRIKVTFPGIVIEEAITKYGEAVQKHLTDMDKALKGLERLGAREGLDRPAVSLEHAMDSFRSVLMRRIEILKADVLETPTIKHDEIVRRLLDRRKPFNQSGEGYRDTLIWEGVMSCLGHHEKVAFVSSNWRDFASSNDGTHLAEDLVEDVTGRGYAEDSILLYPSLHAFVSAQVEPATTALQTIKGLYESRTTEGKVIGELFQLLHSLLPRGEAVEVSEPKDDVLEQVTIERIEVAEPDWLIVQEAWPLEEGQSKVAVSLWVGIEATLNALVFAGQPHGLDEEPSFKMLDSWDPAYSLVEITRPLTVFLEGTFDLDQHVLSDVEMTEARVESRD